MHNHNDKNKLINYFINYKNTKLHFNFNKNTIYKCDSLESLFIDNIINENFSSQIKYKNEIMSTLLKIE